MQKGHSFRSLLKSVEVLMYLLKAMLTLKIQTRLLDITNENNLRGSWVA